MVENPSSLWHEDLEKRLNALREDRREEIENIWSQIKIETPVIHQVISQDEMDNLLAKFHLKKSEDKIEENTFDVKKIKQIQKIKEIKKNSVNIYGKMFQK